VIMFVLRCVLTCEMYAHGYIFHIIWTLINIRLLAHRVVEELSHLMC
jgi:hypothetical protein